MDALVKIRKYFILVITALMLVFTSSPVTTETAELIGSDMFVMENALIMGQGITTDGEYYYTSGSIAAVSLTALGKYDAETLELVDKKINPLPSVCRKRGNNHIGGISYYDGKLYASVEGGGKVEACIVVFDAGTLEATGEIYDLPNADYSDGVPWCAVDSETGYLYASKWSGAEKIFVYDTNNEMALIKEIKLPTPVKRIQGGEFYNGTLYLSQDTNDSGEMRKILSVNVDTGELKVAAERNVGSDNIEAEGMTFTEDENGPVMHVLDYNRTVGVFLNHYRVDF